MEQTPRLASGPCARRQTPPGRFRGLSAACAFVGLCCFFAAYHEWKTHLAQRYAAPVRLTAPGFNVGLSLPSAGSTPEGVVQRTPLEAPPTAPALGFAHLPAGAASPVPTMATRTISILTSTPAETSSVMLTVAGEVWGAGLLQAAALTVPEPAHVTSLATRLLQSEPTPPPGEADAPPVSAKDGEAPGHASVEAFERDWRCPFFPEFCDGVRQLVRHGGGDLGRAIRPRGHVPDLARVFSRMDEARRSGRLSVAVLGNSITEGCGIPDMDWSHRLESLLRADPGLNLTVSLQRIAGSGANLDAVFQFISFLKDPDVIIVDMSMGENGILSFLDRRLGRVLQALRALPSRPAILFHEYAPHFVWRPLVDGAVAGVCDIDIRTFGHWESFRKFGVPVFSYFDLACQMPRQMTENWVTFQDFEQRWNRWFETEGNHSRDAEGAAKDYRTWRSDTRNNRSWPMYSYPRQSQTGPQHPTCDWHEVVAHVFALVLRQAVLPSERALLGQADAQPAAASDEPAESADGDVGPPVPPECWTKPDIRLENNAGPSDFVPWDVALNRSIVKGFRHELGPATTVFPALVENSSWVWARDAHEPGWIAVPGRIGRIRFRLNVTRGFAVFWYLQTYDNIGPATCRLGDGPDFKVDPRIAETISVPAMQTLSINLADMKQHQGDGQQPPGDSVVDLECRTDGDKFKITGVLSC